MTRASSNRCNQPNTPTKFGLPTVQDILKELEEPTRPAPVRTAQVFKDGVEDVKDLQPGMILRRGGLLIANFGAFV